ncbi:MAG: DUF1453 domain-containing protein [Chthoniobacterales bacterium]
MPLLPLLLLLLLPLLVAVALPFSILQRYRVGTARRRGRRWKAALNLAALAFSCVVFIWVAAFTNFWDPRAFPYSLLGLGAGGLLGLLGLFVTRWEETPGTLHYTPNRWLILFITFAVALRLIYGVWRAWHAWGTHGPETSWLAAAGGANSMAVGAVVLGYYLVYHAGVWRRLRRRRQDSQWTGR